MQSLHVAAGHFQAGRLEAAEQVCRQILSADRNNPNALYLLGVIAHQSGQQDAAIELLAKSLKRAPQNAEAQNYLGIVFAGADRSHEAARCFRRAVKLQPSLVEAHNNLGNTLRELGRMEDSAKQFRIAISHNPGYSQAYIGLSCCMREMGDLDGAAACLEKALSCDELNHEAYFNLGNVRADQARVDEAVACYETALQIAPGFTDAYYQLVLMLEEFGRPRDAYNCVLKLIDLEPESARALYHLANCQAALGEDTQAAEAYAKALELCDDTELVTNILLAFSQLPAAPLGERHLELIEAMPPVTPDAGHIGTISQAKRDLARAGTLHKIGRIDDAWLAYIAGNQAFDAIYAGCWQEELQQFLRIQKTADAFKGQFSSIETDDIELPISLLILGPSRSGKSTLERLAGSLNGVSNSHESLLLNQSIARSLGCKGSVPICLGDLPEERRPAFRKHYCETLREVAHGARVVTNTHPVNIISAGWLAELVPNIRMIYVRRNRRDTALRIFMKMYSINTNYYAYNLDRIAEYLTWYEELCEIWRKMLGDKFLIVRYEDMVADAENIRAELVALCGLDPPEGAAPCLADDRDAASLYEEFLSNTD